MPTRIEPESFREVAILLENLREAIINVRTDHTDLKTELSVDIATVKTELTDKIDKITEMLEEDRRKEEMAKTQRTFLIISAFIGPLVVSFFVNAAGIGKL
jgi:hypothetical protein